MTRSLIGILGGTFDPVHRGHTQLAADAINALNLDRLLCVPAGRPPHRAAPAASAADRLAMTQLAFADTVVEVDEAEIRQDGPSWTIRTLERLRAEKPDAALVLIVGADAFLGLPTWHRWQELLLLAHLAVVNRPGAELSVATMSPELQRLWQQAHCTDREQLRAHPAGCLVSFTMTPCPVSATQIRQAVARGESIEALVAAPIKNYIHQHHLYT